MNDQQPVADVETIDDPMFVHGPPIPIDGENGVGAGNIDTEASGAGVIERETLAPDMRGIGLGIGLIGKGLSPALLVSTEPNGIPTREAPPGDGDDNAGADAAALDELVSQGPDAAMPPDNGVPTVIPPPSYVVAVPDIPVDELATSGHATPLPVITGEPAGSGLRPADGSSVAPMAFPVAGTTIPAVMPSGEVVPIPETVSAICAAAGSRPNSTTRIEAINASLT